MDTKKIIKKSLITTGITISVLFLVLVVHLSIVMRPKPVDPNIRALARMDIQQPITQEDANKISGWLYQQKGVDHVLVNAGADIVVFTYAALKVNPNDIVSNFNTQMSYKAVRFMPSAEQLKGGCPVMKGSPTYKIYSFIKHIF